MLHTLTNPLFLFCFLNSFAHSVKIGIAGKNFAAIATEELNGGGGRFKGEVVSVEGRSNHGSVCV